ncbi:uncharacterized protein LOC128928051 isoform X3 [Callithrix jacchus]
MLFQALVYLLAEPLCSQWAAEPPTARWRLQPAVPRLASLQWVVVTETAAAGAIATPPAHLGFCAGNGRGSGQTNQEEPEKVLPEPEETWVMETLCGLKVKLKLRRVLPMLPEHYEVFNRLLGTWPMTWRRLMRPPNKPSSTSCMGRTASSDPCSRSFGSSSSVPCTGELVFPQRSWRRSRLMIQRTGCGYETTPSFPRAPGTMEA